ncbi:MAG TPA: MotA/TolQ/ExbB proton channel family protein [Chryseolinea sp.]|nr:MotA/TolQ/ExbB proton channel family protein [Chryseolinea sp.]
MILLQIVSDAVTEPEVISAESLSVIDLTIKGGFMMIPIVLLWVLAIYLFVERILAINKANEDPEAFMGRIKELVHKGDINGAKALCSQNDTPVARMIEKGVARIGSPLKNIEASIENIGKIEVFKLEKNLPLLATIAGAAPMLGFLGTVIGMVKAFIAIAQEQGYLSPELLSSGMYSAMITTIAGLIVGLTAFVGYNYLVTAVRNVVHKMEYTSIDFIDLLQETR